MACKKVTTITNTTDTKKHISIQIPVDPMEFAHKIQRNQGNGFHGTLNILLNKGRYYEVSTWNKKLSHQISWIMSKEKFCGANMFCGPWTELETFVAVCNSLGYYCVIKVDWI